MKTENKNLVSTSVKNSNLPIIEMILTYNDKPQIIYRDNISPPTEILWLLGESETEYKENLSLFLCGVSTDGLYKISNCIYCNDIELSLPQWYLDCNGKVFFDETEDNFKLQIV